MEGKLTIFDRTKGAENQLLSLYSAAESQVIARWLASWAFRLAGYELVTEGIRVPDSGSDAVFQRGLEELLDGRPIQYVTGQAFFYGLELRVGPEVLIPRPETEELVRWIVEDCKEMQGLRILDIGTGSGCILAALGLNLRAPALTGWDISAGALKAADYNLSKYQLEVNLRNVDVLDENLRSHPDTFDLIVSNPPYVRETEKRDMNRNVIGYEPHAALFVPDHDPLIFYRAISQFASRALRPGGRLYLEVNEFLAGVTAFLVAQCGLDQVEIRNDFRGKKRMIRAFAGSARRAP
jgi:release factor glutamine methyltransferase